MSVGYPDDPLPGPRDEGATTDNQFTCAVCDETFDKAWSDEEAEAEAAELWTPDELAVGISVTCDDCFQRGLPNARAAATIARETP
jgi:hypothetical protein